MSAVDAARSLPPGERQGLALFATHGVADAGSTLFASAVIGAGAEGNPLVATLLAQGWGWAAGTMLAVTGAVAIAYPRLRDAAGFPDWFGWGLAAIGAAIAVANVGISLGVAL